MDKMQKITRKQIGIADNMIHFGWIANIIMVNGEESSWVVGGPGVNS